MKSLVFSYAVPTAPDKRAFLRAWGVYEAEGVSPSSTPPLLATTQARVFLQGQFSGRMSFPAAQPGAALHLSLGSMLHSLGSLAISDSSLTTYSIAELPTTNSTDFIVGDDKNIRVTATSVLPTHKTKEEESSGWFVSEKKKYRVKVEDLSISVTSSYDRSASQHDLV